MIIRTQFVALRDGDRFWYERVLTAAEREEVKNTRLSDIIRRNTGIGDELDLWDGTTDLTEVVPRITAYLDLAGSAS